jgi:hypothetical protein
MKKLRNSIIIVLCLTFVVSAISALFSELLTVKADPHNYNINYTTLSYSELDSVSSIFFAWKMPNFGGGTNKKHKNQKNIKKV